MGKLDDYLDRIGIVDPEVFEFPGSFEDGYLEKCGLKRVTTWQKAKEGLLWGTYGPDQMWWPNARWVKIIDCDTKHLMNILIDNYASEVALDVICEILLERHGYK